MSVDQTERFEMLASAELLAKVDAWRNRQDSVPSRTEAIRRLIDLALRTDGSETADRQFGRKPG
jgi:hypothetical protein